MERRGFMGVLLVYLTITRRLFTKFIKKRLLLLCLLLQPTFIANKQTLIVNERLMIANELTLIVTNV